MATIASLPLADEVPIHGVPLGPRGVSWRATAPHTLYWVEALDGGNPVAEAAHRDRLMRLDAPFTGEPEEVFRAEHRIVSWQGGWGAEGGTLMLTQRERIRRWRYTWLLDVDKGTLAPVVRPQRERPLHLAGLRRCVAPCPTAAGCCTRRETRSTSPAAAPPTRATGRSWTCATWRPARSSASSAATRSATSPSWPLPVTRTAS